MRSSDDVVTPIMHYDWLWISLIWAIILGRNVSNKSGAFFFFSIAWMRAHNRIINFEITRHGPLFARNTATVWSCLSETTPPAECQSKIRPNMAHSQQSPHVWLIFLGLISDFNIPLTLCFAIIVISIPTKRGCTIFWRKKLSHPNIVCGVGGGVTHKKHIVAGHRHIQWRHQKNALFLYRFWQLLYMTREMHIFCLCVCKLCRHERVQCTLWFHNWKQYFVIIYVFAFFNNCQSRLGFDWDDSGARYNLLC